MTPIRGSALVTSNVATPLPSVDTVAVVLPDDIASGPITIGNSLGSYRGKIFSVGMNLTRAAAVLITVGDWADHYSQEANYLRLNGVLPPTAQRRSGM